MNGLSIWHWIVILLCVALVALIAVSIRNAKRRRAAIARGAIQPPRGFGGWLAFYCIMISLLYPLRIVAAILKNYADLGDVLPAFPKLALAMHYDAIMELGLVALAMWAGISLWRIVPTAVSRNSIFLWTYLIVSVVEPFLFLLIADLPDKAADEVLIASVGGAVGAIVFFAVWWNYFRLSVRVRSTYGATTRPPLTQSV